MQQFSSYASRFNPVDLNTSRLSREELDAIRESPLWPYAAEARRDRFPFDAEAFLKNREAFNEAEQMRNLRRQVATNRALMLRATPALRERVEAKLNR